MNNDSIDSAAGLAIFLVFFAIYIGTLVVAMAVGYLITAWSLLMLFRKTGIPQWKAWVPVYNSVTWLRLGGQNGIWGWLSLIPYVSIATSIFIYIGMHKTNIAFRKETGFFVLGIFFPFIWALILGYGSAPYEPYLIAQRGYRLPLEGYGSFDPDRQHAAM